MQHWYFETSAVNSLEASLDSGTLATRSLQESKGRKWCLSPVTIWEILLTSDPDRREELLDFCKHIFSKDLLPAPDDLIVGFVESGMGTAEPRRELVSSSHLGVAWREIVDDPTRTLRVDEDEFRRRAVFLKRFAKNVHLILRDESAVLNSDLFHANLDASLSQLVRVAFETRSRPIESDEVLRFHKVALFYVLLIFCGGASLGGDAVRSFWGRLDIRQIEDRINYVVNTIPELIWRGPFVLMAYMTLAQLREGFSRGLWFDCLHSVYASYVEYLITNDRHFVMLREGLPSDRLKRVVVHMSEIELTTVKRDWLGRYLD